MSHHPKPFLTAYCTYAFLFDFIFAYAIYTAYFELNGLSFLQIGALLAFWSGTALILEIFTGALSDWLDRRWLLIAAPLFKVLTFVCWGLADGNIWLYGAGFGFWALAGALYSGTGEALLFERLEAAGQGNDFDKYYGRASAAEALGIGAGLLFGGAFAAWSSMDVTIWLSIPPLLLASLTAVWLRDIRTGAEAREQSYLANIRDAFHEFRTLPDLRFVAVYIAFGLIIFGELEEFDQLYYTAVELPLWLFGVAGAIGLGVHAIVSINAHRLAGYKSLAWILPALGGVLFIIASFADRAWFVIVLELGYLLAVPPLILAEARFQHLIESKARATTTSVLEVLQNITGLTLALAFGLLAHVVGILPAYGWAGLMLLPISGWVWWRQANGAPAF